MISVIMILLVPTEMIIVKPSARLAEFPVTVSKTQAADDRAAILKAAAAEIAAAEWNGPALVAVGRAADPSYGGGASVQSALRSGVDHSIELTVKSLEEPAQSTATTE